MTDGPLFDEAADPVERSRALDQQLLAIPADRVFTKRAVVVGFVILLAPLLWLTTSTNLAVRDRQVLEKRNAELEGDNAVQEDLLGQSTDAIVLLLGVLDANGIEAPEIIIRSTTTTTEEP